MLKLVENIQTNQVFGASDLMDILKCAPATATNLIKRMKTMNLVETVTGIGKGKYVFRSPLQQKQRTEPFSSVPKSLLQTN